MPLSKIDERDIETAADLVAHDAADANPARLSEGFQPRRYVHSIAENVAGIDDDIADIDADSEFQASIVRHMLVSFAHRMLNLHRARHCVNDARKFH